MNQEERRVLAIAAVAAYPQRAYEPDLLAEEIPVAESAVERLLAEAYTYFERQLIEATVTNRTRCQVPVDVDGAIKTALREHRGAG
ncbi:MAG: hypothetical protein F4Z28_05125 [Gammaproteobacteria bacterium]|nr:hypothetical protein [Gammaproteobacteria bacterium]